MAEKQEEVEERKPQKIPRTLAEKDRLKRLIVILENASLETIKVILLRIRKIYLSELCTNTTDWEAI